MERRTGWSEYPSYSYFKFLICKQAFSQPLGSSPTAHLPHLLRILGPSALTLYKHVLGRKRILIYTLPPVEVSCILCQIAADICFDAQTSSSPDHSSLKGKHKEPISVLGMITLTDIDRLAHETRTGRGWIACKHLFYRVIPLSQFGARYYRRSLPGETFAL